jgi:site-specific DNA recombinase
MSHAFSQKAGRRYRYYVCVHAQKYGWSECPSPSVPAGEIERVVLDEVRAVGRDPRLVTETLAAARRHAEERLVALKAERRRLERQLREGHRDLSEPVPGPLDIERAAAVQQQLDAAEVRLAEVESELAALTGSDFDRTEVSAALGEFDALWAALSPRERAEAVGLLVERVEYDGAEVAVTFRPNGLEAFTKQIEQLHQTDEEAA